MAPNLEELKGELNAAYVPDEELKKKKEEDTSSSSISSIPDIKDGKKKKKKKEKEPPPEFPPVPFFDLFRYATPLDMFLGVFATLGAVGTGICFPLMLILFGDITNAFVGGGLTQEQIDEINCAIANDPNYTYPFNESAACNSSLPIT